MVDAIVRNTMTGDASMDLMRSSDEYSGRTLDFAWAEAQNYITFNLGE